MEPAHTKNDIFSRIQQKQEQIIALGVHKQRGGICRFLLLSISVIFW